MKTRHGFPKAWAPAPDRPGADAPDADGRPEIRGFTLSAALLLVFLLLGGVSVALTYLALGHQRDKVVDELGFQESHRTAEQIHQHLYSVMRKGWSRAEIDDTLARIRQAYPDIDIRVIRGEPVARQYGDDPQSAHYRAADPRIATALRDGQRQFRPEHADLRYLMPLPNHPECQTCHQGDSAIINGLIDLGIPTARLRAPIQATLNPLVHYMGVTIIAAFLAVFLLVRYQIIHPIVSLTRHVRTLTADIDRGGRLAPGNAWPREVRLLAGHFNDLMDEVRENHRRLTELAVHDPLTGLYNRRHFDEMLTRLCHQAQRQDRPLSLLMLDLDDFKGINDRYGHATGDRVLRDVGREILRQVRKGDIACRTGGDEFVILAAHCPGQEAQTLAQRLRQAIAGLRWPVDDGEIATHASIGIAHAPEQSSRPEALMEAADRDMYRDKEGKAAR